VEFSYRLVDTGWAQAHVGDGENRLDLTVSYLSDAPADLLGALRSIQDGAATADCLWAQEPGVVKWELSRAGDSLRVKVLSYGSVDVGPSDADGKVVFECEGPAAELERAFTTGLRDVLARWGEAGYLAEWVEYPFPKELLELVEARIESAGVPHIP
jgi:hypothetical protein